MEKLNKCSLWRGQSHGYLCDQIDSKYWKGLDMMLWKGKK